jgi:hypothetical protein
LPQQALVSGFFVPLKHLHSFHLAKTKARSAGWFDNPLR